MKKTLLACAIAIASIGSASAATIIPVNLNAPGVGLNDPTAAAPVGLNPGTTVGEQRRIAYQFAADLWGAVLESDVDIRVNAQFTPLSCTATGGVLGSAGATTVHANFTNSVPDTWYGAALANSLAGSDLAPATNDINSNFNANLGSPGCLENSGWYYGLDGNTPAGRINFLDVVMHEIGHGLNFQGFYNSTTAAPFGTPPNQFPDIYSRNVFDNASSMTWVEMTNEGRLAARVGEQLVWTGAEVTGEVPDALAQLRRLFVAGGLTASYDFGTAAFGAPATEFNFSGAIVAVNDGSAAPTQGCVASPAGAYAGRIALVDRGTCSFGIKARFAQDAGAIGVIVANNAPGAAPGLAGDPSVNPTIPTISVAQPDGAAIRAALGSTVTASIQNVPGQFAGADSQGRARINAPATFAPGSSFSHFDVSHFPNALMEPSINQDLDGNLRLDLTPSLYADMGWVLNDGNAVTRGRCNTGVPVLTGTIPGLIGGANLQAADKLCRTNAKNKAQNASCLVPFVSVLRSINAIPASAEGSLASCSR